MQINAKRVRRKCNVRGCTNKDCITIARSHELGNSIIICKDCLKEALDAFNAMPDEAKKAYRPLDNKPSLFYHPAIQKVVTEDEYNELITAESTADSAEVTAEPPAVPNGANAGGHDECVSADTASIDDAGAVADVQTVTAAKPAVKRSTTTKKKTSAAKKKTTTRKKTTTTKRSGGVRNADSK